MKKLASVFAGLLLCLSTTVFADAESDKHVTEAMQHANKAVEQGKAGQAPSLVEHAKLGLEHTMAAAITAKGVPLTHINAASNSIEQAIDHGNLGHTDLATKSAEEAVEHLKAVTSSQ
ncbi:MAG: small metal-binding protein SmbP [Methylobacter sp.]